MSCLSGIDYPHNDMKGKTSYFYGNNSKNRLIDIHRYKPLNKS